MMLPLDRTHCLNGLVDSNTWLESADLWQSYAIL